MITPCLLHDLDRHAVGPLWMSDQLIENASTYVGHHYTKTNIHASNGIRAQDHSKQAFYSAATETGTAHVLINMRERQLNK
jgi:hypothetical protein